MTAPVLIPLTKLGYRRPEDAIATLTPGLTWTTEDGVEAMVVPVEVVTVAREIAENQWCGARTGPALAAALSAIRKE